MSVSTVLYMYTETLGLYVSVSTVLYMYTDIRPIHVSGLNCEVLENISSDNY